MTYSFDIFDTLITRKTITPQGVFLIMQQQLDSLEDQKWIPDLRHAFSYLRIQAERDIRYLSKKSEITLSDIYERMRLMTGISQADLEVIMNLELEIELKCCVPIEKNILYLKSLLNAGEKVILISDMYLSKQQIWDILKVADVKLTDLPLYVSSEYGCTKASGQLYIKVREMENLSYESWTHIGDNQHSDIYIPQLLGIKTKSVITPEHMDWENLMMQKELHESNPYVALSLGYAYSVRRDKLIDAAELIGMSIGGPILMGYVHWLTDMSQSLGITKLYFIARDGFVLKQMFEIYCKEFHLQIKSQYIYGSRVAWRVDSPEERENVKAYIEQEVDFESETVAFVDLNGTGASIDYLQRMIKRNITVFYFNLYKGIKNENVNAYSYTTIIHNTGMIETLCRAPHGATLGYEKENGRWTPILTDDGEKEWEQSRLGAYTQGVMRYTETLLQWCKELQIRMDCRAYVDVLIQYVEKNPSNLLAGFIGDIVHSENNESRKYASELQIEDVEKYMDDPTSYSGSNFLYSLRRSEKQVQDHYDQCAMTWAENSDNDYDETRTNVVLYGAGLNGQKLYRQLKKNPRYQIVNWVDMAYQTYQSNGMPVTDIQKLKEQIFDFVIITVKKNPDSIKKLLVEMGIAEEKIKTSAEFMEQQLGASR